MMFTALLLTADAQTLTATDTVTRLEQFCPYVKDKTGTDSDGGIMGGYYTWETDMIDIDDWYWGEDWDEWVANNTSPKVVDEAGAVYPAGFKNYVLGQYSEPPICMLVEGSSDKKVEILMESPLENANLCIRDASYTGAGNNEVGNIENCGSGKIYACFTAATQDGDDFGFYVTCEEGCEDMEVDVWIRVRVSPRSWDQGKDDLETDLEHWCAEERGTHIDSEDYDSHLFYTYPSDLIPDEPSEYPFHIHQIFGRNAGAADRPSGLLLSMLALGVAFLLA